MDLHDLIRDRGLPRNRVARLARAEATRRLETEFESKDLADREIETEWPEIGLGVRTPAGSSRYQYTVTSEEAFVAFVVEEIGFNALLSEEEIALFVHAGMWLRKALDGDTSWEIRDPESGERANPTSGWPGALAKQLAEPLDRLEIR